MGHEDLSSGEDSGCFPGPPKGLENCRNTCVWLQGSGAVTALAQGHRGAEIPFFFFFFIAP